MQISLSNTVGVDVDVHEGLSVLFVNLLEAAQEIGSVIFLEAVGTQDLQTPLITFGNPVEGSPEGVPDGDFRVLRLSLLINLHPGAPGRKALRQQPARHIASQPEPIATKVITINKSNGAFMWVDLDWVLPYVNDEINAGGSWYVVYNQAALPSYMESINFGRDWSREPCGTCNKGDLQLYRLMQRYVTLSPFYVAISDWDETLWDVEDNIYTPADNYGLNMMFTMACDVTETLIAEKFQFANLIQLQVAAEALRDIATNPEVAVNRTQSNVDRNNVLFEVFGDGASVKGIQGELTRAYKAIAVDLKGLDPLCMSCKNKGIRYVAIV